jgi:hypothetical protein
LEGKWSQQGRGVKAVGQYLKLEEKALSGLILDGLHAMQWQIFSGMQRN